MFKGKKVFVSGGAGVIGTALVLKLYEKGARIFVGDLKPRPQNWPRDIQYRQGDLNYISPAELQEFEPEYFFHLAATFERSIETYDFWGENYHHNVNLSHHLMTCLKDVKSLKKVVFASTYLVYDPKQYSYSEPTTAPTVLTEESPINPRNLCGAAKLFHEAELQFLAGFDVSFEAVSARIFRSYGKDSRDVISRWIRSLIQNEALETYAEEGMVDYIYASEVAEGLIQLALSPAAGVVNLGNGNARRVTEVLACLKTQFPQMVTKHIDADILYEASQADLTYLKELTKWLPAKQIEDAIPEITTYEKQRSNRPEVSQPVLNLLVTSVSKKTPLIQGLRKAIMKLGCQGRIFGADASTQIIAKYFVDEFWQMPRLDDIQVADLIEYCHTHNISCIIPTRDGELQFFAENKELLATNNIKVMISSPACVETCSNKLLFYEKVSSLGFPAIKTVEDITRLDGDAFVVKEKHGAGSRKIGLGLTRDAALAHAAGLSEPIFQPFIKGQEMSIDLYVDKKGRAKGAVARKRVLVVDGESQVTVTVNNKNLEQLCSRLAEALGIYGHAVFQVIEDPEGNFHIIECNNRFGGASSLSLAVGLDSFYWFLLESLGEDLDTHPFVRLPGEKTQVRYAQDMVF